MPLVEECGLAAVIFELPAHFSVESPARKAFGECHPGRPLPQASFFDASCLDVIIPGVFRVAVDNVSAWLDLKISSGVFNVWRVMDFGRRPAGPDKPKAQMFEDGPDNRRVLNAADEPHFPLTLRADQRICLVYFLDQS